jgi:transcriptional regulator GlxA family with amidase domain
MPHEPNLLSQRQVTYQNRSVENEQRFRGLENCPKNGDMVNQGKMSRASSSDGTFHTTPRRQKTGMMGPITRRVHPPGSPSFSANEFASSLHISYRTRHRRFRAVSGMTHLNYLHVLRVEYAKELLEMTQDSVEQIAAALGNSDTSSFRRLFTRLTSKTPA